MSVGRKWIPNQHGAWAMLIAPVIVGALASGPNLWHLLLLLTWLSAFCLNFYTTLAIKSRKPRKYAQQMQLYVVLVSIFGIPLVLHDIDVLRMLIAAVPAFAVNVFFVLQRNERAWVNDVVGVALAGVVGYGAYLLGSNPTDDRRAFTAVLAICLYFVGTVIYVKTLIRERGSAGWLQLSYGFHAMLVIICVMQQWWIASLVSAGLLGRAVAVPRLSWTPKRVGLTEIASTTAVALAALYTLH